MSGSIAESMGDFIIQCYEMGTISFELADALILLYDPVWQVELIAANDMMSGGWDEAF